uniref:Putative secreted peptide n=1 Tax=Anopheles braziliensis TaxID=58242 RepID=A0A2M3ZNU5_9DIPT
MTRTYFLAFVHVSLRLEMLVKLLKLLSLTSASSFYPYHHHPVIRTTLSGETCVSKVHSILSSLAVRWTELLCVL